MFPSSALPHLLAAERAMGALLERIEADPLPGWKADALRREALASLVLDSDKVVIEDLAICQVNATAVAHGLRPGAERARMRLDALTAIAAGFPATEGPAQALDEDDLLPPDEDWDEEDLDDDEDRVRAAARASVADINACSDTLISGGPVTARVAAPVRISAPLSSPWLARAWDRLGFSNACEVDFGAVAAKIDESMRLPGLAGAAQVIHALHASGLWPEPGSPELEGLERATIEEVEEEDHVRRMALAAERLGVRDVLKVEIAERRVSGPGWAYVRAIAPWIVSRACGCRPLWISSMLRRDGGYNAVASASASDFCVWFGRVMASGLAAEKARLIELKHHDHHWRTRLAETGVRPSSAAYAALELVVERPAMDVKLMMRRFGFSHVGAKRVIDQLTAAGVLEEIPGRGKSRIWVAPRMVEEGRQ